MDSHGVEQVVVESRGENSTTEVVETTVSELGNATQTSKSIEIDTKMTGGGPNGQQLSELIQLLETCQLGSNSAGLQQNLISALLNDSATKVAVSSSSSSNSVSPQQQQQQSSNSSPPGDNANLLALAQIMLQKQQQQQLAHKSKSSSSSNTSPVKSSALLNPASNTMQQALDSIYNMNGSANNSSSSNNAAVMAAAQLLKSSRAATRNASSTENLPSSNTSSPPLSSNPENDVLSNQLLLELIRQDPSQLEQLLKLNSLYKMSMANGEGDSSSNSSSTSTSSTNSTSNMNHSSGAAGSSNTAVSSGTLTPSMSTTGNGISLIEELQQHLDPVTGVAAATAGSNSSANNLAATVSSGPQQRNSPKVQPHYMNQMPNSFQHQPQQNYNQLQHQLLNNLNLNALNHLVNRNDMFNNIYKQQQVQSPNLNHQGLLHQQPQHHHQQHHHQHAGGQPPQLNAQLLAQYAQVSPQHQHLLQQLASGNVHAAAAAVHNLLGNGSMPMMNAGPTTSSLGNGPFGNIQIGNSGNGLPDLTNPGAVNPNGEEKFSRKVFVGGLPPDIDEDEIVTHFRRYGNLIVDWPHKAESKSYFPPKGYAFLIFQEERSVQELIETCVMEDGKLYLVVSSPSMKDKPVQIRPWCLADSDFVLDGSQPLDPRKTIFVGGVPRPLKALELAMIMNRFYGGVCYAGIDTDPELKYPKGAGRVAFSNQQSYIAAISARFVQLQHGDIDKRVEVKPYVLDDQMCDECQGARCGGKFAPFFCANVTCLQYYCEACWATIHTRPGREYHKPLVKEGADRPRSLPYK